jgi:signal transduction histidine kinase/ligand-binding sensor domain-containing protein
MACALLLLSGAGFSSAAQKTLRYSVESWDTEKGLPQNSVFSILQTKDGYLWCGTGNGLARFDGLRFKTYDQGNTPELPVGKIFKLFEDSHTNLWISTEQPGASVVRNGVLTNVDFGTRMNERAVSFAEDSAGNLWVNFRDQQLLRYNNGHTDLRISGCRDVIVDASNLVWLATQETTNAEPYRLKAIGPVSSGLAFVVPYDLPAPQLDLLLPSRSGGYWRLGEGRVEKWRNDHLEKSLGNYPWQKGISLQAATEDEEGNLIVGTYGDGVWWYAPDGHAERIEGLSHASVWSLALDREGTLWVGTDGGGLNRVRKQAFDVLEPGKALSIKSVCEDTNHALWFSINDGGIKRWHDGQFTSYRDTPSWIASVFADKFGTVWAGSDGAGLYLLRGNRFQNAPGWDIINTAGAGPLAHVSCIYQDETGKLWIGTQAGIVVAERRSWGMLTVTNGLSENWIRAVVGDGQGGAWVGTESAGINHIRTNKVERFGSANNPAQNKVSSLHLDRDGVLWVGTAGGLGRLEHGKWTAFTRNDGLVNNNIGFILEDGEGYLWLGSTAGLMRVDKRGLNAYASQPTNTVPIRVYGLADGLPSSECAYGSQPAACRASDGTLWFPTIKGLAFVKAAALRQNTNPPPVVIEAVRIDGVAATRDSLGASLVRAVTVPPGKGSFEIYFTSLNLSAPEKGRVRYRLAGLDDRWTEKPGDTRSVQFIRVPAGKYVFELLACNEDYVWSQSPTTLAIHVLPPFWQTWWFMALSALFVFAMVVGSVYYVSTQRLHRQLESLRQQEALEHERARIARDLHDQLGANLTQVALLGELAESDKEQPNEVEAHARQISQTARETTHALDEIVWTVNPSNDTLNGLINYVCKYAQEYFALADLKYRLEVPPDLPTTPISPELRHNMFLAAKESVNNVVKHAQATSAWLRLRLEPQRFVLEIEDDGRGLPADATEKGRNGLKNMRKRMEDVGGSFEATKGAEGGTLVKLAAPLK